MHSSEEIQGTLHVADATEMRMFGARVDKTRTAAEALLKNHIDSGMSYDEARKLTVDVLSAMPGIQDTMETIHAERQEQIHARTKLTERGTSRQRDIKAMGWYAGVSDSNGVWGQLRQRMLEGGLAGAVDQIHRSTEEIVASIAEPNVADDKRLGLVIGNVQSGKTANFSAVTAKALDSGYKFVLVLSGIHNNLRKQTQERLERDLGVLDEPHQWYKLTNAECDFARTHKGNSAGIVAKHDRILAVAKKNSTRLRHVLEFLRSLDSATRRDTPFLIIDDESDQATPDSSAGLDDEPTAINRLMREIWAQVGNGTYIGYTATPFANVFMNPNSEENGELAELYPKDFAHVMPTPQNYFGAERIFGLEGNEDRRAPDVIREVPDAERDVLSPKEGAPSVTASLGEAIRWFVVAAAVRRARQQQDKHSTMLIHTTHRVNPHFQMRDAVREFLEPLQRAAREGDVESFRDVFHREFDRAAELYTGDAEATSWPRVSQEIPHVLRQIRLSVDNGRADSEERLTYTDNPQPVIVIGGGTLSRGLTLEGLFVSFFTRTSNTYDTLLQMGRWFGYRPGYEDLQRVWLSPGLDDDYRFLATVEAEVREDIARMTAANQTPEEIGIRVSLHPGRLQITNPAKMKHVTLADFAGFRLQTTRFDAADAQALERNVDVADQLRKRLAPFRHETQGDLFEEVPVQELHQFFEEFSVHSRFQQTFHDAYIWAAEQLPEKRWNVVIPYDDHLGTFRTVERAPMGASPEKLRTDSVIDIRALMTGNDILADLRLQGRPGQPLGRRLKNSEQLEMREDPSGLDGRGLLLFYPISRTSPARDTEIRMDMEKALHEVNPVLTQRLDSPIMGVALIAPTDTDPSRKSRGTQVAVRPVFGEPEIHDDDSHVDSEGDYQGDAS